MDLNEAKDQIARKARKPKNIDSHDQCFSDWDELVEYYSVLTTEQSYLISMYHDRAAELYMLANGGGLNSVLSSLDVRIENECETGEIVLSVIDRGLFPRIWKDNDTDGRTKVLAGSNSYKAEQMNPFLEKDWIVRFYGESIKDTIDQLSAYMESMEPLTGKRDLLIYGKKYRCYKENKYIGVYTYTDDPNIGDCFLSEEKDGVVDVAIPDHWEFK